MRKIRNGMFVVLVLVAVFALNRVSVAVAAADFSCNRIWEGPSGYSLVCDYFPDYAVCWAEWEIEDSCWDWCWNSQGGQHWLPDNWGCENEGPYQIEIWCGCWNPGSNP